LNVPLEARYDTPTRRRSSRWGSRSPTRWRRLVRRWNCAGTGGDVQPPLPSANQPAQSQTSAILHMRQTPHSSAFPSRSSALTRKESSHPSTSLTRKGSDALTPHFAPHFRARRSVDDRRRRVSMRGLTRPDAIGCHPTKAVRYDPQRNSRLGVRVPSPAPSETILASAEGSDSSRVSREFQRPLFEDLMAVAYTAPAATKASSLLWIPDERC
jgi:hypothetical protein